MRNQGAISSNNLGSSQQYHQQPEEPAWDPSAAAQEYQYNQVVGYNYANIAPGQGYGQTGKNDLFNDDLIVSGYQQQQQPRVPQQPGAQGGYIGGYQQQQAFGFQAGGMDAGIPQVPQRTAPRR